MVTIIAVNKIICWRYTEVLIKLTVELYRVGDSFARYRKDKWSYLVMYFIVEKVSKLGILEGKM